MSVRAGVLALLVPAVACGRHAAPAAAPDAGRTTAPAAAAPVSWVGTWMAAQQLTDELNMPTAPLTRSTLRQVIRTSIGGTTVRVRLSNAFGDAPMVITAARIARAAGAGSSAVYPATERTLTFGGRDSVVIAAGASAVSDSLRFDVPPLADLAVTLHFGWAPGALTGHPGSRTTSFIRPGSEVSAANLFAATTEDHWYVLAGLDVATDGATGVAVVALGNSITEGRGSGTNRNARWTDFLAQRLQADPRTRDVAVLNAGIGGNRVLAGGNGPTALSRLDRDVFGQSGARFLIVLAGANDIGEAQDADAAATIGGRLITAYRQIIARARGRGLRVYGATILPFEGSSFGGRGREAARQEVNAWIRTGGAFDAVIDVDAVLRDPYRPSRLLPAADSGDHLHPSEDGYRMMADAVDLSLFVR